MGDFMDRPGLLLSLAGLLFFCGCGCGGNSPSAASSPAKSPTSRATASTTARATPSPRAEAGSGGGGGGGSGSGAADEQREPSRAPGVPSGPERQPTRAELDRNFEQDSKSFPSSPSLNQNPTEARALAVPRTIEAVAGLNGYDIVSDMYEPSSTIEAIQSGRSLFKPNCGRCHGMDGKPNEEMSARLVRYSMADLSQPMQYKYGADGKGIYRSIAYGTAAPPHGMYYKALNQQQIWSLVAFVESMQKEPPAGRQ